MVQCNVYWVLSPKIEELYWHDKCFLQNNVTCHTPLDTMNLLRPNLSKYAKCEKFEAYGWSLKYNGVFFSTKKCALYSKKYNFVFVS